MQNQIFPASGKRRNLQAWTPIPGSDATDEYKRGTLANIQIQKKDSDEDMYSFSD